MNLLNLTSSDDKKIIVFEAGIKVLRKKGVTNTSMNDIIRESGLSKGGVYHYFSSKNALLIELCQYFFEVNALSNFSALQNDPALLQKSAIEQIDILIQQHEANLDHMRKNMTLMMELYIEAMHNKALKKVFNQQYSLILGIIKTLIEAAQQQGDLSKDVDSSMLSASLLAIFEGFGLAYRILDHNENYPRMALDAARMLLAGAARKD